MGEWLRGLPPTILFHRSQVLIIPQSQYQQKLVVSKSPHKGATTPRLGSKAQTDMVQLETDDDNDHTRRDATLGGRRDESTSKRATGRQKGGDVGALCMQQRLESSPCDCVGSQRNGLATSAGFSSTRTKCSFCQLLTKLITCLQTSCASRLRALKRQLNRTGRHEDEPQPEQAEAEQEEEAARPD
jgi:hypothetical protein